MWLGSQAGHQYSNHSQDQHNATTARKSDTRHLTARKVRFVANVLRRVITIETVSIVLFQSVSFVEAHTNRLVEAATFYIRALISRTFQIL
jgi:hypothetical protein